MVKKIIINQQTTFDKLELKEVCRVSKVLKTLGLARNEEQKAWFIEIDKIFKEKNLKIFYIPFKTLLNIFSKGKFHKLPDPRNFLVGVTFKTQERKTRLFEQFGKLAQLNKVSFSNYKLRKKFVNKEGVSE